MKRQILIATLLIFGSYYLKSQQWVCGTQYQNNSIQSMPAGCSYNSTAYNSTYKTQSFYIPTSTTPVIKVKYAMHIFDNVSQSGNMYKNNSTDLARLNQINAWVKTYSRYSDPRFGHNAISPVYINDSRVEYECVAIYFYYDNTLASATAYYSNFWNYVNTNYPGSGRLDVLPVFISNGPNPTFGAAGNASNVPSLGDVTALSTNAGVVTGLNEGQGDWFAHEHLLHEIGHCMGWLHMYNGGSDVSINQYSSTLYSDFLSDIFPLNNPYCGSTTIYPGNTCENIGCVIAPPNTNPTANNDNNVMSGCSNHWMSPLQMARRRRSLSLNYVRKYVADMTSDHTNVWNITASETWDFDIQMYNDIVVKAGNTLTIKCKVGMAIDGKIKVEKGAKLVVDGGQITTWCKTGLWKGIEVDGDNTKNQNLSGGYGVYQGYLNIINSSTITNAQNAICTYTTDVNGNMNTNSTGGIVICSGSNFINNVRSAEFYYYYSPNGGNLGSFTKCNFNTTSALLAGNGPSNHATLFNVDGVKFLGCNFEYSAGSAYTAGNRGNGIYSIDAQYFVDQYCNNATNPCTNATKTEFKNLVNGVYADNANPLRVVSIQNTNFLDVFIYSTYFSVINTPVFQNNYVRTQGTGAGIGLYLNYCKYYNVKNNTFLGSSTGNPNSDNGIYVNNSSAGAHKIYRNSFANFNVGIAPLNDNSGQYNYTDGLKINCNNFTPTPNLWDISMMGTDPTVMKDQGSPASANTLVRNRYAAVSSCPTCENKWSIIGTSVKLINHPSNSSAFCIPTPQPANSDQQIYVTVTSWPYNDSQCPANETGGGGGGGGSGRLAEINNHIDDLSANETSNAKGINTTKSKPSFDMQAAIAEKLNYFLLDTLPASKDSVIAILQNNPGGMEDADVQLTYAYINKGDFMRAKQNITALSVTKPDWAALQSKLIALYQHPKKSEALKTDASLKMFLENFAANEDRSGRNAALAMLKYATGKDYFVPKPLPFVEDGVNKSINSSISNDVSNADFNVFPNPASGMVNVVYKGKDDANIHLALTNALGAKVYEADIKGNTKVEISMENFSNGVYLLTAFEGKTKVYQTKVINIK